MNKQITVLIVDDEPRISKLLSISFKPYGYKSITVTSGVEALEVIRTNTPDVMLLDILMPGLDGFQVLEKLRSFSSLPVVAFSCSLENGPRALKLGANDFLSKPFDLGDLVKRIENVLIDK
jgi:two-component system KDP operon response regulator KdpE